jgi:hypothetical protein
MLTFCAGCAGDIVSGAVRRGSWLYCSVECALAPGRLVLAGAGVRPGAASGLGSQRQLSLLRAPRLRRAGSLRAR